MCDGGDDSDVRVRAAAAVRATRARASADRFIVGVSVRRPDDGSHPLLRAVGLTVCSRGCGVCARSGGCAGRRGARAHRRRRARAHDVVGGATESTPERVDRVRARDRGEIVSDLGQYLLLSLSLLLMLESRLCPVSRRGEGGMI